MSASNLVLIGCFFIAAIALLVLKTNRIFYVMLGVLVFGITFFLKQNHYLQPITNLKNMGIVILIFAVIVTIYHAYFTRLLKKRIKV